MEIIKSAPKLATQDFANAAVRNRVCKGVYLAIARSFHNYPMRRNTQAETQRRFNLCFEGFRILRNEYKWSVHRSIDHLYRMLSMSLRGEVGQVATLQSSWYGPADT
jgi:hypothetical protein